MKIIKFRAWDMRKNQFLSDYECGIFTGYTPEELGEFKKCENLDDIVEIILCFNGIKYCRHTPGMMEICKSEAKPFLDVDGALYTKNELPTT